MDATDYRIIIGGLCYLTHTRPDITFAVGYLSRFVVKEICPRGNNKIIIYFLIS